MALSVSKTINMSLEDVRKFEAWIEKFYNRAGDYESANKNIARAMKRKYGYSGYRITGSNNSYTLNLGKSI